MQSKSWGTPMCRRRDGIPVERERMRSWRRALAHRFLLRTGRDWAVVTAAPRDSISAPTQMALKPCPHEWFDCPHPPALPRPVQPSAALHAFFSNPTQRLALFATDIDRPAEPTVSHNL